MNSPAEPGPFSAIGQGGGEDAALNQGETVENPAGIAKAVETSVDAFYRGRFHLVQPRGRGYRAGLDSLLLAASIVSARAGKAVDLGSGSGAIGLAVAVRCPRIEIALVENDPLMAALARHSLALSENSHLAPRLRLIEADAVARRSAREAAGLFDGSVSTVITNPPFYAPGSRGSPDALRRAAMVLPDGDFLPAWIATSAALLEEGGLLALVAKPQNLEDILVTARNRVGDIRILPVHARLDRPAIRILVHARKGSRAGLTLLAPIVLHDSDGGETPLARAIGAGDAAIDLGLG